MKRILHISKYYYPFAGGVEQIARDCVLALKNTAEQKVICFDHNPNSRDSDDVVDDVDVIRIGQQAVIASQAIGKTYGRRLKEVMADFQPDIIIFHYPNPFVSHYLLNVIPDHVKLIVWWHLDIYKQKLLKYFFYGQNSRLLERADKVVATSPNYVKGSPWLIRVQNKCVVIPNCIDENRLNVTTEEQTLAARIREENQGKILCLAVGRHVPYKGFEYLIRAGKLLDDRFVIQIAGSGPLTEKLRRLSKDDPKIRLLGNISDKELKARLMSCDIFTFSSITKNEGFGIALAEGMYFGHPAVTFHIPGSGVNYVSRNGVTGIEVPNRDVKGYADAIRYLADHQEKMYQAGRSARERVLKLFLFNSFQKNLKTLIVSMED